MTLDELIEKLEMHRDAIGDNAEVRLMIQPSWPFETTISGVVSRGEINSALECDETSGDEAGIVYIVEGCQMGYGASIAWDIAS